jgi:cold shock protein
MALQLLPGRRGVILRFAERRFCDAAFRLRLICSPRVFSRDSGSRKGEGEPGCGSFAFLFQLFLGVANMPQGTIKKLIMDKGFGFIQGERGELFFHHSALDGITIEELREGQRVEFEEGRGPKGPRAENIKLA